MVKYENGVFHLRTKSSSYVMAVEGNKLFHLYWGKKLPDELNFEDLILTSIGHLWSCSDTVFNGREASTEALPMEYPVFGSADLRNPALAIRYADGSSITKLEFSKYQIFKGKPKLKGLPSTYTEQNDEATTLVITLKDSLKNISVELMYNVFYSYDAITRSVRIVNESTDSFKLESALSASLDFQYGNFDLLHLPGTWAYERIPQRMPIINGKQTVESMRGVSSAYHNPFIALLDKDATETQGNVYAMNLVYSGNFTAGAECDTFQNTRAFIGINPFHFEFVLKPEDSFQTPEAVLVFSNQGIGGMSRIYHKLYRERLCRGNYRRFISL